jgi:hypothetical protein
MYTFRFRYCSRFVKRRRGESGADSASLASKFAWNRSTLFLRLPHKLIQQVPSLPFTSVDIVHPLNEFHVAGTKRSAGPEIVPCMIARSSNSAVRPIKIDSAGPPGRQRQRPASLPVRAAVAPNRRLLNFSTATVSAVAVVSNPQPPQDHRRKQASAMAAEAGGGDGLLVQRTRAAAPGRQARGPRPLQAQTLPAPRRE